jgi:hypothetical protein
VHRALDVLARIQVEFVQLRQQVQQNVNGAFDNPTDLSALDALIAALIQDIQDFAGSLP